MKLRDITGSSNPLVELVAFGLQEKRIQPTLETVQHFTDFLHAPVLPESGDNFNGDWKPFLDSLGSDDKFPAAAAAIESYIGVSSSEFQQLLSIADVTIAIREGANPDQVEMDLKL